MTAVHRCLLAVHAHPDDESEFGAGTVSRYHGEGVRTVLVCCTDGGQGRILAPDSGPLGERAGIVEIRRRELEAAAVIVGYDEVVRLDYPDSGPVGQQERSADSFARVPLDAAVSRVVRVIRRERPQVVITYADDQRAYPHPDHLRSHEVAMRAFDMAGSDTAFPETGPPWQPVKLYYTVTSRERRRAINDNYQRLGMDVPFGADEGAGLQGRGEVDLAPARERVTTVIDVAPYVRVWIEGMRAHRCQLKPKLAQMLSIPEAAVAEFFGQEEFILAHDLTPRQDRSGGLETDLFADVA
jgi:mycothiol S-conjugate amidase